MQTSDFIQAFKQAFKPTHILFVAESIAEETIAAIPTDLSYKLQIKPVPDSSLPEGATALLVPIKEMEIKL